MSLISTHWTAFNSTLGRCAYRTQTARTRTAESVLIVCRLVPRQGWHTLRLAWQKTLGTKKTKRKAGTCHPARHVPAKKPELLQDLIDTLLKPLLPAIHASREMLPEEVRPKWMTEYGESSTGCSYVGVNVTPDRRWNLDNFTWEGTYDEATGNHHGIRASASSNIT